MFRNLQIRSKLVAILVVPLLALMVFATVQALSSVRTRVEAERLNRATQFAARLTALVDALQRERAISSGYVASGGRANYGTMTADRVLVNAALQSFRKGVRALDTDAFSAQFRSDLASANASLGDLGGLRADMESQRVNPAQVAGRYGTQIEQLLDVMGDISEQQGSGSLGRGVDALVAVSRAKEAASQAQGLLFAVLTADRFGVQDYQRFVTVGGEEQAYLAQFRLAANPSQRAFFDATVTGPDIIQTDRMHQAALTAHDMPRGIAPSDWFFASSAKVDLLHRVELRVGADLAAASAAARSAAVRGATVDIVGMALVVGLALGSSLLLARSMAGPLVQFERRVREVAEVDLPGVVERLLHGGGRGELALVGDHSAELPVRSTDEIGRLAAAFNSVHRVAVKIAIDQAALRKSIGDMFVNLARRSQSLIDRQLNLIDELERGTEDPGHLADLFRLDHLATRMRRNAENLLVLANTEPGRRWSDPVPIADVLRAASSEVEDFSRVELASGDRLRLAGHASSDVVHLLAELIENAISFSPPDTAVRLKAQRSATGYLIEIEDSGIGMSQAELAAANKRLADPPAIDFALERMLGFFVVGRLAGRHGIQVRLRRSRHDGVTAQVLIPGPLLLAEQEPAWSTAGASRHAPLPAPPSWTAARQAGVAQAAIEPSRGPAAPSHMSAFAGGGLGATGLAPFEDAEWLDAVRAAQSAWGGDTAPIEGVQATPSVFEPPPRQDPLPPPPPLPDPPPAAPRGAPPANDGGDRDGAGGTPGAPAHGNADGATGRGDQGAAGHSTGRAEQGGAARATRPHQGTAGGAIGRGDQESAGRAEQGGAGRAPRSGDQGGAGTATDRNDPGGAGRADQGGARGASGNGDQRGAGRATTRGDQVGAHGGNGSGDQGAASRATARAATARAATSSGARRTARAATDGAGRRAARGGTDSGGRRAARGKNNPIGGATGGGARAARGGTGGAARGGTGGAARGGTGSAARGGTGSAARGATESGRKRRSRGGANTRDTGISDWLDQEGRDLFADFRTGMVHGRVATDRRRGRSPLPPSWPPGPLESGGPAAS
jgi:signal transduction histidine kinase